MPDFAEFSNLGFSPRGIVYKSGTLTKYKDNLTGNTISTSTTPESVMQSAISDGGYVYVQSGSYSVSGSFAGLNFPVNPTRCKLVMDPNAIITVPNGYNSYVYKLTHGSGSIACSNNTLMGGLFQESGTPQRLWDGVLLQGTGSSVNGVYHNTVSGIQMNYPKTGIHLSIDSSGTFAFVNSNYISQNLIFGADNFCWFDMAATYTPVNNGFFRNRFYNNLFQNAGTAPSAIGFRDIRHNENHFIDNYCADFTGSQATSTIHADAKYTRIDGGTMTYLNFVDNSTGDTTKVNDEFMGLKNGANIFSLSKMTPPSTVRANSLSLYIDTFDSRLKSKDSIGTVIDLGMAGPVRAKKVGGYTSTSATGGWGIFSTMTNVGTAVANNFDNTNGTYAKFSTTTTINSVAGHKYNAFITIRGYNPFLGIKFKNATSATNNILYLGWKASGGDPAGGTTDPLASNSGIMLVQRSTDTNYQICTNNGGANSTFTSTGIPVDTTTINTFMVRADDANTKFQWSLNGSTWTDITTTIPAQTTQLVYMSEIQTTEAVIHDLWIYGVDVTSDK